MLEARDLLLNLKIADWPNTKDTQRSSFHKKIYKIAHPKLAEEKPMNLDDLEKILGKMSGG